MGTAEVPAFAAQTLTESGSENIVSSEAITVVTVSCDLVFTALLALCWRLPILSMLFSIRQPRGGGKRPADTEIVLCIARFLFNFPVFPKAPARWRFRQS